MELVQCEQTVETLPKLQTPPGLGPQRRGLEVLEGHLERMLLDGVETEGGGGEPREGLESE